MSQCVYLQTYFFQISPEGTGKVVQQGAIAADALIGEIGKCCRDLFVNSRGKGENLPENATGKGFRFEFLFYRMTGFNWE